MRHITTCVHGPAGPRCFLDGVIRLIRFVATPHARRGAILLLSLAILATTGCKEDEFANAPGVKASDSQKGDPQAVAPNTRAKSAIGAPAPKADGEPIPKSGQLPSDHPPIGAAGGAAPGPMPQDKAPRPRQPVTGDKIDSYGKTGPLRWEAPESWQGARPSSSMRLAEYIVPGPKGSEAAVVSIFYFGKQGGGGVEANIDRWVGQFTQPDGTASSKVAERETKTVNGMTVHTVDVSGDYNAGAAMGGGATKKGQRVLGAIVEAPAGLFFFKLLGPEETVAANERAFEAFVQSFQPAG